MSDGETKDAWAVLVNTDLTEGRGRNYIKHICEVYATAKRLARKADVQGVDGTVLRIALEKRGARWFGPVEVEKPTEADLKAQKAAEEHEAALERAKSLGLTDDELRALQRGNTA